MKRDRGDYMIFEPGEVVALLPATSGEWYRNQTRGFVCDLKQIRALAFPLGHSKHIYFDPKWWHKNIYRHNKNNESGFVNNFPWPDTEDLSDQEREQIEEDIATHPEFITFEDFAKKFEDVLNSEFSHYDLSGFKVDKIKEAWVEATCMYRGEQEKVIITWQNSD